MWFRKLFEDKDGLPSSKRVQSFLLFALGLVLVFMHYPFDLCALTFGAALGLQGVTSFQR